MPRLSDVSLSGQVLGVKETIAALEAVGAKIAPTALRRALYAGAKVVMTEARRNVPVRTGALRKSIVAQTDKVTNDPKGRPDRVVARVTILRRSYRMATNAKGRTSLKRIATPKGKSAYVKGSIYPRKYAHLVEFGTAPHKAGVRQHPGAKPAYFMRRAAEAKMGEALDTVSRVLTNEFKRGLQSVVNRGVRRAARKAA